MTLPPPDSVTALPRLTIALPAAPLMAKVPSLTMAPFNCVVEPGPSYRCSPVEIVTPIRSAPPPVSITPPVAC